MPVRSDAATAADRWATGMSNAGAAMRRGVSAVQTAPNALAAQAVDKWLNRTQMARDKYVRRNQSVSLQQWQGAMTSYGIDRVAQGAQAKKPKFASFMTEFLPYLKAGVDQIAGMPKNTLEDSIARASAMIRHNAGFQRGAGYAG